MSRGDTAGNGRGLAMDYDSVKARMLAHCINGAHGSTLVSVRVADVRAIIEWADQAQEGAESEAELAIIHSRIERAIGILRPKRGG